MAVKVMIELKPKCFADWQKLAVDAGYTIVSVTGPGNIDQCTRASEGTLGMWNHDASYGYIYLDPPPEELRQRERL